MSDFTYDTIDGIQFDVLREIGNIGAVNATAAFSRLISPKINIKVPKVELLDVREMPDIIGGAEKVFVGIMLGLEGDINGALMFMMEEESAHHIINIIMHRDLESFDDFTEMDFSELKEIGNIFAGSYLSSISMLTNLTVIPSVPSIEINMAGAILGIPAIQFGVVGDKALVLRTQIIVEDKEESAYFALIPDNDSYTKMMSSLGL